jgi:hypothetical protein
MKRLFEFLYWDVLLFVGKIFLPLFIIVYLGIYPLFGNKVHFRWGDYEFSTFQCWLHICVGIIIIIYNFDCLKKIRIHEVEHFFEPSDEKSCKDIKRDIPLKEDPIEKLWNEEESVKN